tara:strand:- start:20808 stop:21098 length:291 start_codon:yes stop_codon:yes gene_type:complete
MSSREVIKDSLRNIKFSPSQKMVFSFDKQTLLKHNALILHKASSLSSRERKMVQERINYGTMGGTITTEEVVDAVNELTQWVEDKLKEEIDDSSSN